MFIFSKFSWVKKNPKPSGACGGRLIPWRICGRKPTIVVFQKSSSPQAPLRNWKNTLQYKNILKHDFKILICIINENFEMIFHSSKSLVNFWRSINIGWNFASIQNLGWNFSPIQNLGWNFSPIWVKKKTLIFTNRRRYTCWRSNCWVCIRYVLGMLEKVKGWRDCFCCRSFRNNGISRSRRISRWEWDWNLRNRTINWCMSYLRWL